MAIITALGVDTFGKISGSMPGNSHEIKIKTVNKAIKNLNKNDSVVDILMKIGDPMQPFQAYFGAFLSILGINVILAGGTQMIAVGSIIKNLGIKYNSEKICIATTKWVTEDKYADVVYLMRELKLDIPLISANLDFSNSKYKNLKLYEKGYVKEGVGAGGLASVVFNNLEITNERFLRKIESVYERIYLK